MKPLSGTSTKKLGASSLRRLRIATILLVSSFAVLVMAAGTYNLAEQYRAVMDTTTRSALSTAWTIQSHATQTFSETFRVLEGIADFFRHATEQGELEDGRIINEAYLHDLMATKLPKAPALMTYFLLDKDYIGIAGARTFPVDVGRAYMSGISFEAITDIGGDLLVGEVYRDRRPQAPSNNTWIYPVGVRVMDRNGTLQGFVFALIRQEFLRNISAASTWGPTAASACGPPTGA